MRGRGLPARPAGFGCPRALGGAGGVQAVRGATMSGWDWLGDLGRILTAAADAKLQANAERERVRAEEAAKSAAALEKLRLTSR